MMRIGWIVAAMLTTAISVPAAAIESGVAPATARAATEIAYGSDKLQRMDVYPPAKVDRAAPLLVFVHGGGWRRGDKGNATGAEKVAHFTGRGYALASINYRLVPDARVEDQAADVAQAIAYLVAHAREIGIDPHRIVLMGHSAGAHLAALVGTDPRYLAEAGLTQDRLAGVILLDGAAYDVPRQLREGPRIMQRIYSQAFGDEPARQRALSPTLQAAAPNARDFLILHVDRQDGTRQSKALADALTAAGARVSLHALGGKGLPGHMAINRDLGDPAYPGTPVVDSWLDRITARR